MYINTTHNLWKFGEDTILQTAVLVNYVWKYPNKRRYKINGRSTFSHIWHIDITQSVYRLDTDSVKVWSSYVLQNTKYHLSYYFQTYGSVADLPEKSLSVALISFFFSISCKAKTNQINSFLLYIYLIYTFLKVITIFLASSFGNVGNATFKIQG